MHLISGIQHGYKALENADKALSDRDDEMHGRRKHKLIFCTVATEASLTIGRLTAGRLGLPEVQNDGIRTWENAALEWLAERAATLTHQRCSSHLALHLAQDMLVTICMAWLFVKLMDRVPLNT